MAHARRRLTDAGGYNIIELMFVMGIMAVIAGMSILQIGRSRPGLVGDSAQRVILGQMNRARELAITQRRYMRIVFTAPNQVTIVREDNTITTTTLSTVILEGGVVFSTVAGLPDTPDAFGNSSAVSFGAAVDVKFTPDGTLVNQNGQVLNGSVFLALGSLSASARSITVLGSTGRIRGYKWDGRNWSLV